MNNLRNDSASNLVGISGNNLRSLLPLFLQPNSLHGALACSVLFPISAIGVLVLISSL